MFFKNNLDFICNYERKRVDLFSVFMEKDGEIYFNVGKHKGEIAKQQKSYLRWIIDKSDFSLDTKMIAKILL